MSNFWDDLMGDDEHAATYMETYGEGIGSDTRKTLQAFINDGESLLDVGCGPGWNLDHFTMYGPKLAAYKGLDYSERMVRVANARIGNEVPKFYVGDARELKELDNSWDVVLLQDCLEHTNGFEKPLHEAMRVARKRVIVTFWHLEDTDNPHINDDGNDGWGAWYDKREWESFIDTLGYMWMHYESKPTDNRQHDFYVIDKEEPK